MSVRIAYLTGEYPRATDTFIQREVAALRQRGLTIETLSVRRPGMEHQVGEQQCREAETTWYILPTSVLALVTAHIQQLMIAPARYIAALGLAWSSRPLGIRGLLYQLFYFAEAALVARHMRMRQIEHLHNHFANSSCSVAMLAATMGDVPFSFTMHGPQIFFTPQHWRIDMKIARARFVVCISYFCRSQAMLFSTPTDWYKLKIVHCGIDPAHYIAPINSCDGIQRVGASTSPVVQMLFVGRLAAVKGVPILLDAIATLAPCCSSLQLTIVGDGPLRPHLERRAQALEIGSMVTFRGYLSQDAVRKALRHTDIFVLPSFAEGVPVVLMEAMAAGVPVVATNVAGVGELVDDGISGVLARPGDAVSLADCIKRLINDAGMRQRIGDAGRAKVASEFNIHRQAQLLSTLFTARPGPVNTSADAARSHSTHSVPLNT